MKNVVIYLRSATNEQASNQNCLAIQEQKLKNYCAINRLNIMKIFKDEHTSGLSFDRPAYSQLKRFVQNGKKKIDGVLFTNWTRFSRNMRNAYDEITILRSLGIEVNSIEQWIDFSIPENQYLLALYMALPHKMKSIRVQFQNLNNCI